MNKQNKQKLQQLAQSLEQLAYGIALVANEEPDQSRQRYELGSELFSNINYDAVTRVLTLEMTHGRTYEYYGVDKNCAGNLLLCGSFGWFYNQFIKGRFDFKEITNER